MITVLHTKKGKVESQLASSLALLKQQVMINIVCHRSSTHASHLIGIEMPALPLVFPNRSTDILVVLNFHAFIFFQLNITFCSTLE